MEGIENVGTQQAQTSAAPDTSTAGAASAGTSTSTPPAVTQQPASSPTSKWGSGINPLLRDDTPTGGNQTAGTTPATAGANQPPAAPTAGTNQPASTPATGQAPTAQADQGTQSAVPPQQPAAVQPKEPEVLDFGGRRVPLPDDPVVAQALKSLHEDWRHLQRALTQARQSGTGQSGQQAQPAHAQPPQQQAQQPSLQEQIRQAINALPPKQREELRQRLADMGLIVEDDSSLAALGEVVASLSAPMVQSLQAQVANLQAQLEQALQAANWVQQQQVQEQFTAELTQMQARPDLYPDLDKLLPVMDQVFELYPDIAALPNAMSVAYRIARGYVTTGQMPAPPTQTAGTAATPQPAVPAGQPTSALPGASQGAVSTPATSTSTVNLDQLLANQTLVQQLVQHPQIRDQVIRSYLEDLRKGQPPAVIGASPGGAAPAAPANTPRNIKEASAALRAWLGQRTG